MTSPKKEVAPAKLSRGDHEEESQLTRPESYAVLHGVDSPSSPPKVMHTTSKRASRSSPG